jgi:hypothetical protein
MTKQRRRDKESVAKNHRNMVIGGAFPWSSESVLTPNPNWKASRGELSTAALREAKLPMSLDSVRLFAVIRTHYLLLLS